MMVAAIAGLSDIAQAWDGTRLGMTSLSTRQQIRNSVGDLLKTNQNPRAALAARQTLRDQVCIAMADRRIDPSERKRLLADANRVLKGQEYTAFEQWLAQLSPLPPSRPAERVVEKAVPREVATTIKIVEPLPEPTIPENVVLPDRMAAVERAW